MFATFVNCLAVLAGTCIGLLFRRRISDSFRAVVMTATGTVTVIISIGMALKTQSYLSMVFSAILGGLAGSALRIEDRICGLGEKLARGSEDSSSFARGFLNASVLFCTGAMAIVGSIQAGTSGDYSLILVKSVMDGCMAAALGALYGVGVAASALTVLAYQGFFTLAGRWIAPILGEGGINEMGATGGLILLLVAFNLLGIRKTKAGDYLPAIVFAPVFSRILGSFG